MVCQVSDKDFYALSHASAHLTSLMALGLQMKVFYHTLMDKCMGKAEEAMTQLSDVYSIVQATLLDCEELFQDAAGEYVQSNSLFTPSDRNAMAADIEKHLDTKYSWYDWTVTVVQDNDKPPAGLAWIYRIGSSSACLYLQFVPCDLGNAKVLCSDHPCHPDRARCRDVKAMGSAVCQCGKMFNGEKCDRSVRDDIDLSFLGQGDNPIIVPDLTTIYYSIMDLKALLKTLACQTP